MAEIEEALRTRLVAVSAVTNLVGTRIHPDKIEDQSPTTPYVTYELLGSERASAMGVDTGDVASDLRFHIWAKNTDSMSGYDSAKAVAVALRGALQRFCATSAGVVVENVFITDEFAAVEPEPEFYHRILEVQAQWKE